MFDGRDERGWRSALNRNHLVQLPDPLLDDVFQRKTLCGLVRRDWRPERLIERCWNCFTKADSAGMLTAKEKREYYAASKQQRDLAIQRRKEAEARRLPETSGSPQGGAE